MAQLNITLNQEEILQLLCEDHDGAFRQLLQSCLNSVLRAESAEQLQADPYERTEDRMDSRNGFRDRSLTTRIGKITLQVPRHRNQPFKTMIFENYSRSEAALVAGMAEMVVNGVSTRKVSKVVETLCGTSYSKSAVSDLCKDLTKEVEAFRHRPLEDNYPFLSVDATYFKARIKGRIVSRALMIAYGVNERGVREILGFDVYHAENKENWKDFLTSLKKRGLHGMVLITSDAHEGIRDALRKVFPTVPWQRCQFHFMKNITDKAPKKYQAGLRTELNEMFNSKTIKEARARQEAVFNDYKDVAESAMLCLDEGFADAMSVMLLPEQFRVHFRTTNPLERLNRELKRRSDVIGIFPNDESILRLMGSVLIERNEAIQSMNAVFSPKSYATMMNPEVVISLRTLAKEQLYEAA